MNARRVMNGSLVGLAAAAIVAGLFNVGSPTYERQRRSDELREQNLQQLDAIIISYARNNKDLPATLAEATAVTRMYAPRDPETGAPYGYKRLDATNYALCANFKLSGRTTEGGNYPPFNVHPAGSHCFELKVEQPTRS